MIISDIRTHLLSVPYEDPPKIGFIDMGFPYYGWLISVFSAVINVALKYDIPLIFYGEDGEVEYGGSTENKNKAIFLIHENSLSPTIAKSSELVSVSLLRT